MDVPLEKLLIVFARFNEFWDYGGQLSLVARFYIEPISNKGKIRRTTTSRHLSLLNSQLLKDIRSSPCVHLPQFTDRLVKSNRNKTGYKLITMC
jgi:hypothetical protein